MKLADARSSIVAMASASVASLCCLFPLAVVVLGLGSGAFMAVTMRYTYVFIPAGVLGTGLGWYLHLRERRRCQRLGCAMAGGRVNGVLLGISTVVLAAAVVLTAFPDRTARLIASWGGIAAMEHEAGTGPSPSGGHGAVVAARVILQVDGMT